VTVTSPQPHIIVVSGPPGSGKTTLATALSANMRLPLFAKDAIKEVLMSTFPVSDVDTSKKMGQAAMAILYSLAAAAPGGAVLESNFHRTLSLSDLQRLPGAVVEVFCRCDREVALARYRARSEVRHPGHFDSYRTDEELWSDEVTTPIGGRWPVIEVDTNHPIDVAKLVLAINRAAETTWFDPAPIRPE
jgi:predicted kinase